MKVLNRLIIPCLVLLFMLLMPVSALAQPLFQTSGETIPGDKLVLGDTFTLSSGQTLEGDLAVVGGNAVIEKAATVSGNVILVGGNLELNGNVHQDVVAMFANVTLGPGAIVDGEIRIVGGNVSGAAQATVRGGIQIVQPKTFIRNPASLSPDNFTLPDERTVAANRFLAFLGQAAQVLAVAVLGVIVGLLLPKPTKNIADNITDQPWMSGGAGLLAFLVIPLVLIILTITIILIPFTLLAALAFGVAALFGWIAVGYLLGERLAALFKTDWADAVSAGLGTLVLGIAAAIIGVIPCLGGVVRFLIICVGLGGVVLSAFGTRPPAVKAAVPLTPADVIPPASPPPDAGQNDPPVSES